MGALPAAEGGLVSTRLPDPPYYAVIFASQRTAVEHGYGDMAERMVALAAGQPGYLGVESTRGEDGFGITVSYWRSPEDIAAWRRHAEHRIARDTGRSDWYAHYSLRVAKVERAYAWAREDGSRDPQP
ncbi:antibiotic biosynthesis monooxygenase family protein [Roseateles saccharophilus]|uniref:Heme-degrading monooxygenase HmoA n=1 Tax=Roseateles saccharophilus TaxID=304 RepID=A0A4R3VG81_ROSSA|nr:antibiotic biosynthesis monooxygenase [Roseateles saccharophilus]TCV04456.1 heme-degrading monooxygenase HmoA [Roseateles saccharophilus]